MCLQAFCSGAYNSLILMVYDIQLWLLSQLCVKVKLKYLLIWIKWSLGYVCLWRSARSPLMLTGHRLPSSSEVVLRVVNLSCHMSPAEYLWLIGLRKIDCHRSFLQIVPEILMAGKYICSFNSFHSYNLTKKISQGKFFQVGGPLWTVKMLGKILLVNQKTWLK